MWNFFKHKSVCRGLQKAARYSACCMQSERDAKSNRSVIRHPFCKACLKHSQKVVQSYMWFKEEPSQFYMGQTAQSLTCYIMEKPCKGLADCLNMLLPWGPIVKQKFWLEKWLEKQLEKRLEISYTGKRQKIDSLRMSQNQKGMWSRFSSRFSSQNFCFAIGPLVTC